MSLPRSLVSTSAAVALFAMGATDARAAAQRTFVASYGLPANTAFNCSVVNPCRAFSEAIGVTVPGGEIIVLDSAAYGAVTIAQPVSIVAPAGIYAGISVFSGTGIVVNAGSGTVVLSGLTINGLGGATGIDFQSGSTLRIDRTVVSGFGAVGNFGVKASLGATATLVIQDGVFAANDQGVAAATSAGLLAVEIDRTRFIGNTYGAVLRENVAGVVTGSSFSGSYMGALAQPIVSGSSNKLTFRDCTFSTNQHGIVTGGFPGTTGVVQVTDSEVSENTTVGVIAQAQSTVTLSNTTVTRNATGVSGAVRSFQDNRLYGNTADGTFSAILTKQ
jgi:hypothetical protein